MGLNSEGGAGRCGGILKAIGIFLLGISAFIAAIHYSGWNFPCPHGNDASDAACTFYQQFDATLQPHGLQGFEVAPTSSDKCVYVAKIIPLEASTDGAHIENYYIEPECDGKTWHDVIRIVLPPEAAAPLKVHVVIYKIAGGKEPPNRVY